MTTDTTLEAQPNLNVSSEARDWLAVSKDAVFGPTIQGEGPSMGRRCVFLRLAGCNLACSWCDTSYTWDWTGQNGTVYSPKEEVQRWKFKELEEAIEATLCRTLVVTGGEPMLQKATLLPWLRALTDRGWIQRVEVETNGTVPLTLLEPRGGVTQFNVSPKLAGSHNSWTKRRTEGLANYASLARHDKAIFKFVIARGADFAEVVQMVQELRIPAEKVWIMPEGTDPIKLIMGLREWSDEAIKQGWNVTTRLHQFIWGDQRAK